MNLTSATINSWYKQSEIFISFFCSKIDADTHKQTKIYPLPHMYVVKDLVPVTYLHFYFYDLIRLMIQLIKLYFWNE